ncbi:condensin-2 complex subunit G2 [Trichonephila clavipes]|nr:condensin-2 complex subunit G2 [Trichonephila clavipes]
MIKTNATLNSTEVGFKFGIHQSTALDCIKRLGFVFKLSVWEPLKLRERSLMDRISMCSSNLARHKKELFLDHLVTGDKKWIVYKHVENDVKRIYALRSVIPKIINMKEVDSNEVWSLYKQCAASPLYLSQPEHGKVYFDAWSNAVETKNETLENELEITCLQDLILLTVNGRQRSLVLVVRKLLAQFHIQKSEDHVSEMLYSFYRPILWCFLKNSDGLIRANAAQLLLDVFPLEDPDMNIVDADAELNEQMIMIKDLLLDDFPIVRSVTIIGLCFAMCVHWELFPETVETGLMPIASVDHAGHMLPVSKISPHPPITSAQEDRHCEVDPAKRYNHFMDYNSGNGHVCSTPNIRSYGATTFAAVWAVSTVSIILASLDNTAYKETETLVCQ